jgi:hypothetical protein
MTYSRKANRILLATAVGALICGGVSAREPGKDEAKQPDETRQKAGEIVTQPARDVGVMRTKIPPVVEKAAEDPYSLKGVKTCRQLAAAVSELNAELGPDFEVGTETKKENRAGRIAEAGGKTVVNSILPFRGLVRELTGAAPAQRRLNAAIDAAYARRGFLRGVHATRRCRTTFQEPAAQPDK